MSLRKTLFAFGVVAIVVLMPASPAWAQEEIDFSAIGVDLQVNGSDGPVSVVKGSKVNVSWDSDGMEYCRSNWTKAKLKTAGKVAGKLSRSYEFKITCYDSDNSPQSDSVSVNISSTLTKKAEPPVKKSIAIVSPKGGETFNAGEPISIKWSQTYASESIAVSLNNVSVGTEIKAESDISGGKGNNGGKITTSSNMPPGPYNVKICDTSLDLCGASENFIIENHNQEEVDSNADDSGDEQQSQQQSGDSDNTTPGKPVSERITCIFKGSYKVENCSTDQAKGEGSRFVRVQINGMGGDSINWGSSCEWGANTTLSGEDKVIIFPCTTSDDSGVKVITVSQGSRREVINDIYTALMGHEPVKTTLDALVSSPATVDNIEVELLKSDEYKKANPAPTSMLRTPQYASAFDGLIYFLRLVSNAGQVN